MYLTNSGSLECLFIGNGSALNLAKNNTNILLVQGQNHLLLDCGITCPHALFNKTGILPNQINNIAISHLHSDHVGGLETFAWYHFINKSKINLFSKVDVKSLLEISMGNEVTKIFNFVSNDFNIGNLNITFKQTQHVDNMKSYGYIVNNQIYFTMDSCFDPNLNYQTIFHDCSSKINKNHASIKELITLPMELKKKMWLMHLDNGDYGDISDFLGFVPEGIIKL